jgi:threonyl-tRNA synthetase
LIQIGILTDNNIVDMQTAKQNNLEGEAILFDNSQNSLQIIRHSTAHLLAQAIKQIDSSAKFFVGPVINDGFYYDFESTKKFTMEDLKSIEKNMLQIAKQKLPIEKYSITKKEALEKYKNDQLKSEVLKKIEDETITIYKQGDFEDLCKGPHVENTSALRFFKLTKISGAYLGGDTDKQMLTRIYGVAFSDKQSLVEHMNFLEEAKKRDHKKLGKELELFTFSDEIGSGLPIWLPKGARIRHNLENMLFKMHIQRGYEPVRAPEILKSSLWKKSGHYQNYGENMYFTTIDEQEYGIKPMNCLGHIKVYESKARSYRDLPLKIFEYGVVHRHEQSGVLNGLFRVREFTQDDAHIFCMPSQIKNIIVEILEFIDSLMKYFDFSYDLEISTKPQKYIGDDRIWETATDSLRDALNENSVKYKVDEGGGAFYGPKIDIKITDALKRKWQCGTIQVDFNLPEKFDINYIGQNNKKERPVIIHRAILGSFERFIGILIEHYAGEFPLSIAPVCAIIIPVNQIHYDYCLNLSKKMIKLDIYCEVYMQNESLNKRVRMAEKQKVPYVIIIGDEEIEKDTVSIRDRREKRQSKLKTDLFINLIKDKINGNES